MVLVGGGFGGLAAARALRNAPVRVTLIDRCNHHLFQPVLRQIATASLAALTGSAVGGLTPLISNYLIQRGLTERELLARELTERQNMYSEFIRFGTAVYVKAITNEPQNESFDDLVALYALVGRIRLYASALVFKAAEDFAALVTEKYGNAAIPIEVLRSAAVKSRVDPLSAFSIASRKELEEISRRHHSRKT